MVLILVAALGSVVHGIGASSPNPIPILYQPLVPDAALPGGSGFTLTINGDGFVAGSVVNWNGSPRATTYVSSMQLTAGIAASDIASAGTATVTVVNPAPGGGASNAIYFPITTPTSGVALRYAPLPNEAMGAPVIADFNGDGKPDIAMPLYDAYAGNVGVFLGNGDGTFVLRGYTVGTGADAIGSIILGDFNGDGKEDLAVADHTSGNSYILLGNGDGTFQTPVAAAISGYTSSTVVADFNGDGNLDIATVGGVYLGNGDGTFQPIVYLPPPPAPYDSYAENSVTAGDFNGDGIPDLAIAYYDQYAEYGPISAVFIFAGVGSGVFDAPIAHSLYGSAASVTAADLNDDGKLDLVIANSSNDFVSVLLGNGDGTFGSAVDFATGVGSPASVAVGDLNGDGKLDLITGSGVLLGNGNGTFGAPTQPADYGSAYSLAVADFNGDGKLDIAGGGVVLLQSPTVTLSPTTLDFGSLVLKTRAAPQTATLTNTGYLPLTISGVSFQFGEGNYTETNTCASMLPIGDSCTIRVEFKPVKKGPADASVVIADNSTTYPDSIGLRGVGVISGADATLSAHSLKFTKLQAFGTTSTPRGFAFYNYGTEPLAISSIGFTGPGAGNFAQTNTCGSSVAPGANCYFEVTFTPVQGGPLTASLSIADNAPGSPQTVTAGGTAPMVQFTPATLSFSCLLNLCPPPSQNLTLTNVSAASTGLNPIAITGKDAEFFSQTNTCGASLAPAAPCTITVTFAGGGQVRKYPAAITATYDGIGSPQSAAVTGQVER